MPLHGHSDGEESEPYTHNQWQCNPCAEYGAFKFLGMPVRVHSSNDNARSSLRGSLQQMLMAIDQMPLSHQQERDLQPLALKKWAGLARHSNTLSPFQEGWTGSAISGQRTQEFAGIQDSTAGLVAMELRP